MASRQALSREQVTEVAARLFGLRFSWLDADLDTMVEQIGWPVAHESGRSLLFRTGFGGDFDLATLTRYHEDGAAALALRVTGVVAGDTSAERDFLRDAFALAVDVVSQIAGQPVDRRPGEQPEVRWPAPSGSLRVSSTGVAVSLSLLSARYLELLARSDAAAEDEFADERGFAAEDGFAVRDEYAVEGERW